MVAKANKSNIKKRKKCNENWHVHSNGTDKPCECGKIKNFDKEVLKLKVKFGKTKKV